MRVAAVSREQRLVAAQFRDAAVLQHGDPIGGPHGRDLRVGHPDGAFLFPQMTMPADEKVKAGQHTWSPNFLDYLFVAFNTSTAFSPTDVPVLARWGKVLMMLQSIISLTVLVLLAARAVNIL